MSKIKKLKQIDGKADKFQVRTLDQLLGDTGITKYSTMDESTYENQLNEFNKSDLQAHAIQVGLIPVDNRQILTQRLMREFRKHVASFAPRPAPIPTKEPSEEIKKILAGGR